VPGKPLHEDARVSADVHVVCQNNCTVSSAVNYNMIGPWLQAGSHIHSKKLHAIYQLDVTAAEGCAPIVSCFLQGETQRLQRTLHHELPECRPNASSRSIIFKHTYQVYMWIVADVITFAPVVTCPMNCPTVNNRLRRFGAARGL
jgi:hypothetical protein